MGTTAGEVKALGAAGPRPGRHGLQWRVLILVAIGMSAVLAAFSVSSLLAVSESTQRTLEDRRALAEATAGHVSYVVRRSLETLDEVAFAPHFDLSDSDPEPERLALRRAYFGSIFAAVYLVDTGGEVLWTEPHRSSLLGTSIAGQANTNATLESGRPTVSGAVGGLDDEGDVVSMVVPVRDQSGRLVGLVRGDIDLAGGGLSDILLPSVGGTGYAQIVDSGGTVLAGADASLPLLPAGHPSELAPLFEGAQADSRSCHACHAVSGNTDPERRPEIMAFAPVESAPWGVLIRQSEGEALASAQRLKERALWLGIPAFILALLFAWATVRSVVRPVSALTEAAQRLASGDLSQPVPSLGSDEIGHLAGTFETMRVRLKDALETIQAWAHQLEARVQERTRELEASRDHLRTVAEENATLYTELKHKEAARTELLAKVISAQEEERQRIARELHDETSQALALLSMGLDTVTMTLSAGPAALQERLSGLKELSVNTLEGVHRIIYDLRPSVLDDLGLMAGLRWYAESRLRPEGIRLHVLVTGEERRLPPQVETALFRMGQEAMSNVARHARAANVFLGVDFQDRQVSLEVEDDGEGFDPSADRQPGDGQTGIGLLGMRERAALLGGTLEITSEPGNGTRVLVTIALPEEGDEHAKDPHPHRR
ncbi:MAG TPA: HAMP domain-containing protein [Dehalococcoidia bacterium]|nr:HAMP domain-containing protein [Dehalococcoidia bacterium]